MMNLGFDPHAGGELVTFGMANELTTRPSPTHWGSRWFTSMTALVNQVDGCQVFKGVNNLLGMCERLSYQLHDDC